MSEIDWQQVGERIKARRTELGLSQKDVAEPDYTAAYISLVEAGSRRTSTEAIDHIASRLKTDSGYLLHGHPEGLEGRIALALQRARMEARTGDLDAGREQLNEVLEQARSYGLSMLEAKAHEYLGSAHERADDIAGAAQQFEAALQVHQAHAPHLRFAAVAGIARCAGMRGEIRYAIHVLEEYLLQLQLAGLEDPTALMRTYSGLVAAYSMAGLRKEAAEAADKALALGPRVTDPEQIACMNMNVANNLLDMGHIDEALRAVERAEAAFDALGWRQQVAACQQNRSIMLLERGSVEEARRGLLDALSIIEDSRAPADLMVGVLNDLARLERLAEDPEAAAAYLQRGAALLDQAYPRTRAEHRREQALVAAEPDEVVRGLLEAAELYLAADAPPDAAAVMGEVGDLRARAADFEGAAAAYRHALDLSNGVRAG